MPSPPKAVFMLYPPPPPTHTHARTDAHTHTQHAQKKRAAADRGAAKQEGKGARRLPHLPVVEGAAPELAGGAEGVGGHPAHKLRLALRSQLKQVPGGQARAGAGAGKKEPRAGDACKDEQTGRPVKDKTEAGVQRAGMWVGQ
jgi:hypothetical protein